MLESDGHKIRRPGIDVEFGSDSDLRVGIKTKSLTFHLEVCIYQPDTALQKRMYFGVGKRF